MGPLWSAGPSGPGYNRGHTDSMPGLRPPSFIRNVLAVATGTIGGQVIVFAFSPLITRIYSPGIFGLQGVFLSLISILSPLIALRYPMAIVIVKDEDDARRIARLSLLIAFGLSCLSGLILLVARQHVLVLLGAEALGALIWFLPLALFCVALQDVADYRAARLGAFRLVGIVTMAQAFITSLARVLGGLISPVAAILVGVTSVAPAVQSTLLRLGTRKRYGPSPAMSRPQALALLDAHRDFPLYRTPTDVLNAASQSVPVILLAALFSPAAAGLYALTRSVLNLPSNVIGTAAGNVLYVRFAELAREGRPLTPLLLRSTGALLALAPLIVGPAWFAPQVFAFVFGEEWREAGHYAQWMALWIAMMVSNVPVTRVVPVIGRQGLSLLFNVVLLAGRCLSVLGIYWASGSALMAVAWFSASSAVLIILANAMFTWCVILFDRDRKDATDG